MARAKTKTTLIVAAIVLLVFGLGTVAVLRLISGSSSSANFEGAWEGTLEVGDASLRLVAKLRRADNGAYSAVLDSIDQGVKDVPVTSVRVKGQSGRLELKALGASFDGKLSGDQQEWSGDWTQMGRTFFLTFKRTDQPATIPSAISDQAAVPRHGSDLQGYWKGALTIGATRLRLAFKIIESEGGKWTATLDSLDQGARNLPVTAVTYHKPVVEIEVSGVGGFFEGTINGAGTEISGKWTQAGKGMDLVLERGEPDPDPIAAGSLLAEKETDLQGQWSGMLDLKGVKLRLDLKIAKLPSGAYSGSLDSPDQGAKGIPTSRVNHNPPQVRLEWGGLGASYEGTLEKSKLIGTWQQGQVKLPLEFARKQL